MVLLLLIAVPMYLLRRPASSGPGNPAASGNVTDPGLIRSTLDAGGPSPDIEFSEPQRVLCSAAPGRKGNEGPLCDRLPVLERALISSIKANVDCAPRTGKAGSINYVLTVDFTHTRLNVFPGASGQWKGPQAKASAECVEKGLPKVKWEDIPHRYRYYMIAILASYPAPNPLEGFPEFE